MRPLTFWQSAAFQYANPKGWMLAVATVSSFSATSTVLIVGVWALAAVGSLALWAAIGDALRGVLSEGGRLGAFNLLMGALLAATAVWLALR